MSDTQPRTSESALTRGPDPRVVRSRQAALSAVAELLAEEGWTGVTHVAVAARSGVGRTTLYRHWPDVAAMIRDATVERMGRARRPCTGQLRADLLGELDGLRQLLDDPASERTVRAVLERAPFDPAFAALKETLFQAGAAGFQAILRTAVADGKLSPDTDIQLIIDQLAGPVMYRRLFAGLDVDRAYIETIVDRVLSQQLPRPDSNP